MKCRAGVTFEFALRPPVTLNIESLEAGMPHVIAARALRQARKTLKPKNWCSLVVVLERINEDGTMPRLDKHEYASSDGQNFDVAPDPYPEKLSG